MFNLLPKDTVFFDLFEGLARHGVAVAEHLCQLTRDFPDISGAIRRIRDEEHAADDLTHQAHERLDTTFITPFDREDIHMLAGGLDDIIDNVDALAKRMALYHVESIDVAFPKLAEVFGQTTHALSNAVHALRKSRKLSQLQEWLIEVHRLENVGDDVHNAAISKLFEGQISPLNVLRWKDLFDFLENAIDGCEDVANTLERIVLKNG
jgi:predicted phosphate transport protein (TIGR00153 family)